MFCAILFIVIESFLFGLFVVNLFYQNSITFSIFFLSHIYCKPTNTQIKTRRNLLQSPSLHAIMSNTFFYNAVYENDTPTNRKVGGLLPLQITVKTQRGILV